MNSIFVSPPNAILFVLDPTNKNAVVPPYIDGEIVAVTDTCVSVGTQADVDGEVEISMSLSGVVPIDLNKVLSRNILVPGGKIAVVTSEFQKVLELDVPAGSAYVSIWVDDLRNPARVFINIGRP